MTSSHNCHEDATCKNIVGSFECHSVDGFTGDGKNCLSEDKSLHKPYFNKQAFFNTLKVFVQKSIQ